MKTKPTTKELMEAIDRVATEKGVLKVDISKQTGIPASRLSEWICGSGGRPGGENVMTLMRWATRENPSFILELFGL